MIKLPMGAAIISSILWNVIFGLWKIRIMNGWIVSFEWKQANIT